MADPIQAENTQRMWDATNKQVVLVSAPPSTGPDVLTLTVRLHDPRERTNAKRSAWWGVISIPRADLTLPSADFAVKHVAPLVAEIQSEVVKK